MSSAGDRLIMAKFRADKAIDADMKKQFEQVFELLDPFDLDLSYPAFEAAFIEVITQGSSRFLTLEQGFIRAYCAAEFGIDIAVSQPAHELIGWEARDRLSKSLKSVTSASIKAQTAKAQSVEKAAAGARSRAIGVGLRHAREPARTMTNDSVRRERRLKGFRRVTSGSETCGFCDMLASRGAVYDAQSVRFLSHDNCDCQGVPARDGPNPTMDQKFFASARKQQKTDADKERLKIAIEELA